MSRHTKSRELPGERDNARNNARCSRRGRPRTAWMDNFKTWTGLPVEESLRMTEDRDKWRKYVHGVANPRIEDGCKNRTEQLADSQTHTFSSLLRLSAHHLALTASASQPLKSGTLSLYLPVPVTVLIPSVVTSRPTTASRPSNPLNPSPLASQIRLCWPLRSFINYIYLFTYLFTHRNIPLTRGN